MNKLKTGFVLCIVSMALSCNTPRQVAGNNKERVTQYVNTFIGSAPLLDPKVIGYTPPPNWRVWAGLTYPGSALPNAMVQLSPITEYGTGAGYEYEDTIIHGFTHTNKGHWNLCNIPIIPVTGGPNADGKYSSVFSHAKESAGAGFYNVFLEDYQIEVNLTSTLRCGFHRYIYSSADDKKIVFDLSRANNKVLSWDIKQVGNNAVEGFQQVHENTIYFFAYLTDEIESLQKTGNHKDEGLAVIKLKKGNNKTVELKIGLSYVSVLNARQNLESEIGNTSFEAIRSKADSTWEESLSKIELKGGTQKQREMFYSSLYRSLLWPALKSDVNGEYTDANHQTAKGNFSYYAVPSLWDTYRNKLVLLGIMPPKVTGDVIQSLKDIGDKTGFIPTFFHGDHAAPFIAGSYLRGIDGYDVKSTYQLLLRNANIEGPSRPHLNEYLQKGFISDPDIANPHVETKANAGVSKTLEYSYDDYSLAQLAKKLGDSTNYKILMTRSKNYRNMFDPSTNFMRGRLSNGDWIKNFNPQ
ncbi:MAG TPA: GH92 family glycosyl hydrolase, partial [Hanamia sp.]